MISLTCSNCGSLFERYQSQVSDGKNYCSKECYHENKGVGKETFECDYCSNTFTRQSSHIKGDKIFCDNDCRGNWLSENNNGKKHHNYSKINVECAWCGNEFERKPSLLEGKKNVFCDNQCRGNWLSENKSGEDHPQYSKKAVSCDNCGKEKEVAKSKFESQNNFYCDSKCQMENTKNTGSDHPSWKGGKISKTCEQCSDKYYVYQYRKETSRFCSSGCRHKWLQENKSGKNHHQYSGYEGNYGKNWPMKQSEVRSRFMNVCQKCGYYSSSNWHPVHHIIPVNDFENLCNAHFDENMVQLCRSCHYKMERMNTENQMSELYGSKYMKKFDESIIKIKRNKLVKDCAECSGKPAENPYGEKKDSKYQGQTGATPSRLHEDGS